MFCLAKQEGWLSPTERASVSAINLRHTLAFHGYAPWTIAVNVTWMERGFNAGQTHRSKYPSIFNCLRDIVRYWSEIATFSYSLAFTAPVGVFPLEFREKFGPQKTTRQWRQFDDWLSRLDTIPACDGQTDGQRDRRPASINNVRSMTDAP